MKQVAELQQQHLQEKEDLLQHNTVLEADLAALKRQLEEAQKALQNQTTR